MLKNKIKVLIISDSEVSSDYIKQIIEMDDILQVVGTIKSVDNLKNQINENPDIIVVDANTYNLLEYIIRVCSGYTVPVIGVGSNKEICQRIVSLGACDAIERVESADTRVANQFELLLKLKIKTQANSKRPTMKLKGVVKPTSKVHDGSGARNVIAIGASLGGTEVIMDIVSKLPKSVPGIVIVQHMPQAFTGAYAKRLDQFSEIEVHEAKDNDRILPGVALVAPGGRQMRIYEGHDGLRVRLGESDKVGGFCPSVDVMFESVAETVGSASIGVILTGMGRDGAKGLKQMHDSGSYTIGQNQSSCAVFGMPAAAESLGGLDCMMNPSDITRELAKVNAKTK